MDDPFDLQRFLLAQQDVHEQALREIRSGRKTSHWMWFIFPQLSGLGQSATSRRFGISGTAEARAYVAHPILGPRLVEAAEAVLSARTPVQEMFGFPDDMKLQSCATLFEGVSPPGSVFERLLAQRFGAKRDERTLQSLGRRDR